MTKRLTSLLTLTLLLYQSLFAANSYGIPDKIQDGNILHCFDWTFNDIKAMLPQIAEAGFGAVQVSPVQGNANTNAEWFFAYMPYDFAFKANGNGSRQQLQSLCQEAAKYGIKIVVDVVANHVNKAPGYHDTWWDSGGRVRWNGGIDYGNRNSITHGQLGDYGDVNSEDAQVQQRCKEFILDLKSLGVAGIRWDAAKHIGLPSEGCNFWKVVTEDTGLWNYGEILDSPGGDANSVMREYTKYLSVTDNGYCDNTRNAVRSGNVPGNVGGWSAGAVSEDKVVYWGESHDDYSNEWQATTHIPQDVIDRTWAILSCRAGASGLYFSRPSGTTRTSIKMGQKGSTHFTSKEIAAINHLRNAAVGTRDNYANAGGIAVITREGVGAAIIIGGGGARQVSVSNGGGYVPAGTYTDEVSGNIFTVTGSTISGQVGNTGIAVIYGAAKKLPSVTFSPEGGTFRTETLSVTATLVNATSGWYKIDGGQQVSITGSKKFTIGEGVDFGKTITVTWSATGEEGTKTGTVTYKKVDPNAVVMAYYNNPSNWNTVYAYIYSTTKGEVATWPGTTMSKDNNLGLYYIEVPEAFTEDGMVIFNNGSDQQYPASQEPGLPIGGKTMICRDNSIWEEFDGKANPNPGTNPGTNPPTPGPTGTYIYLSNTFGWNAPTVWAWNDEGNCTKAGSWPGDMMTNDAASGLWRWDCPEGKTPQKIIFSNSGNNQSGDLDFINGATYDCSGKVIAQSTPGTNPGTPSDNVFRIFFDNSAAQWQTPYVHYWGGESESTWPGSPMTFLKDNVWMLVVADGTTGLVFNAGDGDATKTPDFTAVKGHLYNQSGDQGEYAWSGVESVKEVKARAYASRGAITVEGLESGQRVMIVNALGHIVKAAPAAASTQTLQVSPGLYIVTIEGKATKLLVR